MMDELEEMQRTVDALQKELTILKDRSADALTLVKLQRHQLETLRKQLRTKPEPE